MKYEYEKCKIFISADEVSLSYFLQCNHCIEYLTFSQLHVLKNLY